MAEQSLQIKRNKTIFDTKEKAVRHLQNLVDNLDDGEIVLCRYLNQDNETIQTLVGFETKYEVFNEETEETTIIQSIAYVDSLNDVGAGFIRDINNVPQLNLGNGLEIDENNKINVVFGEGLKLVEGSISVKVNEKVNNFIQMDDDGLKVTEMKTNVTKTNDKIVVMGGPLASADVQKLFPKDSDNNPYIAANTNIQDLLFKLFCQEIYPIISASNSISGNVTASINAPIIELSQTASNVEVGTFISATTISFNGNSYSNPTSSIVNGMEYGYSKSNNNVRWSYDKSIEKEPVTTIVSTAQTTMVCELVGFSASPFTITGDTVLSNNKYDLGQVQYGVNTINVSISGQPISYTIEEIPVVYPCSNLGKTSGDVKTTKIGTISGTTQVPTNSNSKTINGVRYGYYGIITDNPEVVGQETFEYTSANIRKLTALTSKKTFTIQGDNVGRVIIALPSSWNAKIDTIIDAAQMYQDLYGSETGYSSQYKEVSVEGANNYTAEVYHVYTFDPQNSISINQTITFK